MQRVTGQFAALLLLNVFGLYPQPWTMTAAEVRAFVEHLRDVLFQNTLLRGGEVSGEELAAKLRAGGLLPEPNEPPPTVSARPSVAECERVTGHCWDTWWDDRKVCRHCEIIRRTEPIADDDSR